MTQRRSAVARRIEAAENVVDDATGDMCLAPGADPQRTAIGRAFLPDDRSQLALASTFRALADPTRVSIVLALLRQELCTCDLAAIMGVTESAVSQHVRILRQLRLVRSRRAGRMVFYSLDDLHIRILLTVCLHHIHDDGQDHEGLERVLEFFPRLPGDRLDESANSPDPGGPASEAAPAPLLVKEVAG